MNENAGRLAHKMQPLGRHLLKEIALKKVLRYDDGYVISAGNKVVCQDHIDKRSRYVLQCLDVCHAVDVHEFLQNEGVDVIELEVKLTVPSQREGADGYTFTFTLHADDLSISTAALESNAELVRVYEVGLLQQCVYKLMLNHIRDNYVTQDND